MHTINKLVVDLFLPNRIRENNGIDEANKLYADYIKETLDRVLSSYHENVDLIFTKLTIDLGTISYYEIPYELEKKLREIIDEQIIYSQYFSSNHFSSVVDKAPTSSIVDTMSNKSNVANTNCLQHLKPKSAESELVMDKKEYALEVLIEYMIYGYVDLCGENQSLEMMVALAMESLTETEIIRICNVMERSVPATLRFVEIAQRNAKIAVVTRMLNIKNDGVIDIEFIFRSMRASTNEDSLTVLLWIAIYLNKEEIQHFCTVLKSTEIECHKTEDTLSNYVVTLLSVVSHIMSNKIGYYTTDYIHKLIIETTESAERNVQKKSTNRQEAESTMSNRQGTDGVASIVPPQNAIVENLQTKKTNDDTPGFTTEKKLEDGDGRKMDKSNPEIVLEISKRIIVSDSGLVLVHPFFRMIFSRLGLLTDDDNFISMKERIHAVKLLRFLVTGEQKMNDACLVLEKVICNIPLNYHINKDFSPTPQELEEVDNLLKAVISYWDPFHGTTVRTLREAFMLRKGTIEFEGQNWLLHVEGKSIDLLMDTMPWEFQYIITKWSEPIIVDWQKEM